MRNRLGNVVKFFKSHLANRVAAVVGAMVIAVGAVGGIAYAVSSGSSPSTAGSTSSSPPSDSTQSGTGSQGSSTQKTRAAGPLARLLARAVHAEVVLAQKGGGGYRTVDLDRGTITTVSSTSITIDPTIGGSPVTAAITSTTRQPKKAALSNGETVVLVYSGGDALIVRPVKSSSTSSS